MLLGLNLLKSPRPIPKWRRKWKSEPESASGTALPPKVNQFFQSVDAVITPNFGEIR